MLGNKNNSAQERRLSAVVRKARILSAERQDVVIDMKEADKGRLQLLIEKLLPVFDDVDKDDERFDFTLSSGIEPRFWIDCVAHVHMGRDRRTYRFVRDSRIGRIVIIESGDIETIADHITNYIADRIIEREKLLEGDMDSFRDYYALMTNERLGAVDKTKHQDNKDNQEQLKPEKRKASSSPSLVMIIIWLILGTMAGLVLAFSFYEELSSYLQSFL